MEQSCELSIFHAADREPLADFESRLDRALTDISNFFREEMWNRFKVKIDGIPYERKYDKLVIHVVRGKHPSSHYQHESGDEAWQEVKMALAGVIDPPREHVLIMYGLCEHHPDGR